MWGQHLIVDMSGCNRTAVTDKETIRTFCSELVEKIDMVPYGEPVIEHFAKHDPHASGHTLVQLIETSNITAHFVDNTGDIYLDVFSCKDFSKEDVLEVCYKIFSPSELHTMTLNRDAGSIPLVNSKERRLGMKSMAINLECDVMFNDEGELEVYLYMGDGDDHSVFKFNLKDILEANVGMFTIPADPPYLRHDDMEARDSIYNMSNALKAGAAYVDELQNKYLDNEPSNKDTVE